jgi:hypothetical protein
MFSAAATAASAGNCRRRSAEIVSAAATAGGAAGTGWSASARNTPLFCNFNNNKNIEEYVDHPGVSSGSGMTGREDGLTADVTTHDSRASCTPRAASGSVGRRPGAVQAMAHKYRTTSM